VGSVAARHRRRERGRIQRRQSAAGSVHIRPAWSPVQPLAARPGPEPSGVRPASGVCKPPFAYACGSGITDSDLHPASGNFHPRGNPHEPPAMGQPSRMTPWRRAVAGLSRGNPALRRTGHSPSPEYQGMSHGRSFAELPRAGYRIQVSSGPRRHAAVVPSSSIRPRTASWEPRRCGRDPRAAGACSGNEMPRFSPGAASSAPCGSRGRSPSARCDSHRP
jgi:hypothetical protein